MDGTKRDTGNLVARLLSHFTCTMLLFAGLTGCEYPWTEINKDASPENKYAPTISSIADFNLAYNSSTTRGFTISDVDSAVGCNSSVSVSASNYTILPATGMVLSGSAPNCVLSLTPATGQSGAVTITLTVTDGVRSATSSFTMTVASSGTLPVSISGTPVNTGSINVAYAGFTVTASDGLAPYTYTVQSGSLPPGITLNSSTGAISGTPTADGLYSGIVIRVTDSILQTADLTAFDLYIASLYFDFVSNTTLDSSITFTRASSGTRINNSGQIELVNFNTARYNYDPNTLTLKGLLLEDARSNVVNVYSEQFEDTPSWTVTRLSVTADVVTAPDGTTTGDKIVENTQNNTHYIGMTTGYIKPGTTQYYTTSVYAKAGERSILQIMMGDNALTNRVQADYTLSGGGSTANAATGGSGWSSPVATIEQLPNGWYRCVLTAIGDATTVRVKPRFLLHNGTSTTYLGDGTSGLYLWGAQVEQGDSASSYIPSKNGLSYSEQFGTSPWAISTGTVNANTTDAPAGGTVADTLVDSSAAATGYMYQDLTIQNNSSTYTFSIYVKQAVSGVIALQANMTGGSAVNYAVAVDVNSGDYTTASSVGSAPGSCTVTSVSGWWRVSFPIANNSSGNTSVRLAIYPSYASSLNGSGLGSNTAQDVTLTSSQVFWGAQWELGSSPTIYLKRTTVSVREYDSALVSTGSWFNASEGTVYTSATLSQTPVTSVFAAPMSFTDGTVNNRITQRYSSTAGVEDIYVSGVQQTFTSYATTPSGTMKAASVYKYNDLMIAINGSLGSASNSSTIPTVDRLNLGQTEAGSSMLNGHLRYLQYFENRLPNALLQTLTQ